MATEVKPESRALPSGVIPYKLTVGQFRKMIRAGVFPDGAHVELLGGLLVQNMTKYQPHANTVGELGDALRGLLPSGWFVHEEKAVGLGRYWQPEPDLAIIRGRRRDYPKRPPGAGATAIAVEVSDTTYTKDRGVKWRRYATSCIPTYWIVNVNKRQIEVFTDPKGRGRSASYANCTLYAEDAEVPVVLDGVEVGRIAVKDILP